MADYVDQMITEPKPTDEFDTPSGEEVIDEENSIFSDPSVSQPIEPENVDQHRKQMIPNPDKDGNLVTNVDLGNGSTEESVANTQKMNLKANLDLTSGPSKKSKLNHKEVNDFNTLCQHLETQMKNNITNSFKALKQVGVASRVAITNLQSALNEATNEKEKLQEKLDLLQNVFNKEKKELENKIRKLEEEKTQKTCVACAKVIDKLSYCNSDCLRYYFLFSSESEQN